MKYSILALLSSSLFISPLAFAEFSATQELQQGCAKVTNHAQRGQQYYAQKQYHKAIPHFEYQAAWTAFCQFNADQSHMAHLSDRDVAIANNNVGLSYAKLGKPLWARAWFLLTPNSKISQYNLKQLHLPKTNKQLEGRYVTPAGFGQWNTINISKTTQHYKISFDGYYFGILGLINGPNMGSFTTSMPHGAKQAHYAHDDCKIDLKFSQDQYGRKIEVTQNASTSGCSFGHNVNASGNYYQVEN
ncbi:hypothetical protein [Acinetobacter sp. MD2(2019)]|uniref:hypothetical protein n=1 Tax=Acinetobacter sp. MD2(2019) TaxID=2605273 RepID=UPI002D1EDB88|nr:hypothetical protein [Acinetobacter sp. MD2(2019)]MEB3753145.1 hypothetical protein [Acinetobacter sp. MD2(2019)]